MMVYDKAYMYRCLRYKPHGLIDTLVVKRFFCVLQGHNISHVSCHCFHHVYRENTHCCSVVFFP